MNIRAYIWDMNNAQNTTASQLFAGDVFISLTDGKQYTFDGIEGMELYVTDSKGSTFAIDGDEIVQHIACNI